MRNVIISDTSNVNLETIPDRTPIFAKDNKGKLCGMLIEDKDKGWLLSTGGKYGSAGYHKTRKLCMEASLEYGISYYIEM